MVEGTSSQVMALVSNLSNQAGFPQMSHSLQHVPLARLYHVEHTAPH